MKHIFLLRHAKTEKGAPTQDDRQRVLTEGGVADAGALGKLLHIRGFTPEMVLCSPAARTRETLAALTAACPLSATVEYPEALYLASAEQISSLIQELPDALTEVLIIGHNPGLPQYCFIAAEDKSAAAQSIMMQFPPCSMARLSYKAERWAECGANGAEIERISQD